MSIRVPIADGSYFDIDLSQPPKPQDKEQALVALLVSLIQPRIAVEIGSLYGVTTVCMAHAMPPGGTVYSLDLRPEWANPVIDAWGMRDRIVQIGGDSRQTIPTLPDGIGFAYIDGDHSYGYVKSDTELLWPKLLDGAVVAYHDVWPQMDNPDPLWAPPLDEEIQHITDVRRYLFETFPQAIHFRWGQGITLVQKRAEVPGA